MANKKIPSIFDDDSNCERPACGDISQKFRQQQLRQAIAVESRSEAAATAAAAATEKSTATKADSQLSTDRKSHIASSVDCPVDTATLGNASWTLLHSTAAWYPDQPAKDDQTSMQQLIHAIAKFYPCTYCAHDFQQNLQQTPVVTTTRKELCVWLCEQHNRVNQKLGKEAFPCTIQRLDQRWRKSDDPKCTGSSSSSH